MCATMLPCSVLGLAYSTSVTVFRLIGIALVAVGLLLAAFPGWSGGASGSLEPAVDTFAAIERRVRGGMVLGVGLALIAQSAWRPWTTTLASVVFYFVFGALCVRVLGLMLDGHNSRQWMWVAAEALVMGVAAVWLWRGAAAG